ncbi:MAG TPA: HD-GYP domain-containing protein [Clostridia bacterium]|nr:HD-GYP domain-containing protein [Clostridia bacterium]
MRKVAMALVKPGEKLAKTIYGADGTVLLSAGIQLKERYIKRLKDFGIPYVYIEDSISEGIVVPDLVQETTRIESVRIMRESLKNVQLNGKLTSKDLKQIKKIVNDIVDEILYNKGVLIGLSDIRAVDEYTYGHSVNVCVMSTVIGIALGYNQLRLRDLALGAILHDVGKCKIPKELINKPGTLTKEEFELIKTHPEEGFNIIRQHDEISSLVAHVAYQHHEHVDGTGYPRSLSGKDIHEFAKIVALTDVYDALVTDRPYRKGILPHEAAEIIMASSGTHLEEKIVTTFLRNIALYPNGSIVRLTTGQVGIVVDQNRGANSRPIVRIIDSEEEIDLTKHLNVLITEVIEI